MRASDLDINVVDVIWDSKDCPSDTDDSSDGDDMEESSSDGGDDDEESSEDFSDGDDVETTQPSYDCGATMEECNQAYMDAMSVTCPPVVEPTLYVSTASGLTTSDTVTPASNWMFNQQNNNGDVQAAFGLNDGNTLAVVGEGTDQQYAVVDSDGRVYPTCVMHGASGTTCADGLVCWNGQSAGSASEQRSALLAAAERNDFKISSCPEIQSSCTPLSGYYWDQFSPQGIDEATFNNMCYNVDTGALMYVTRDACKHVCVGFGTGNAVCPTSNDDFYFCPGTNEGLGSFGWPAQFTNAVVNAYNQAMAGGSMNADMFHHPQCRGY
jgi:hypothetical protein